MAVEKGEGCINGGWVHVWVWKGDLERVGVGWQLREELSEKGRLGQDETMDIVSKARRLRLLMLLVLEVEVVVGRGRGRGSSGSIRIQRSLSLRTQGICLSIRTNTSSDSPT